MTNWAAITPSQWRCATTSRSLPSTQEHTPKQRGATGNCWPLAEPSTASRVTRRRHLPESCRRGGGPAPVCRGGQSGAKGRIDLSESPPAGVAQHRLSDAHARRDSPQRWRSRRSGASRRSGGDHSQGPRSTNHPAAIMADCRLGRARAGLGDTSGARALLDSAVRRLETAEGVRGAHQAECRDALAALTRAP